MTGRDFAIALGKRIALFVAIPLIIVIWGMSGPSGQGTARFGLGVVVYFVGIPLWIISAAVVMWLLCQQRLRSLGVPGAIALISILFVLADWRFFMWLFRPFQAPFLLTMFILLIALMLWPDRSDRDRDADRNNMPLAMLGIALAVQVLLAIGSLAGSVGQLVSFSEAAFRLARYSTYFGFCWNIPIAAALIWALIETRREGSSRGDGSRKSPLVDAVPTTPRSNSPPTFGRR